MAFCDVPRRDKSPELNIIGGLFGGLVILIVALRTTTRIAPFKATFSWDDGLILISSVRKLARVRASQPEFPH